MGLDQYLTKTTSIYAMFDFEQIGGTVRLTKAGKEIPIKFERISSIKEEIKYWRKANHIHKWFVDNVQEGKDDCGTYYVSREQLQDLLKLCRKVMRNKDKASELLPTQSGFFFGGTEYDEYYFQDIKETIKALKDELKEDKDNDCPVHSHYYYSSSW